MDRTEKEKKQIEEILTGHIFNRYEFLQFEHVTTALRNQISSLFSVSLKNIDDIVLTEVEISFFVMRLINKYDLIVPLELTEDDFYYFN
ncbi:MAG: hypothetical protein ACFFDN_04905 [Candidatus Hodarchaeota archaeon]